jgi:hypothetical protein
VRNKSTPLTRVSLCTAIETFTPPGRAKPPRSPDNSVSLTGAEPKASSSAPAGADAISAVPARRRVEDVFMFKNP